MEMSPTTASDIWVAPLELGDADHPTTGEPRPLLQTAASEEGPAFSPDGRWLAYSSTESGRAEIYVRAVSAAAGQWQVSRGGGMRPVWSRDGRRIFFDREQEAMVVDVTAGAFGFGAGTPRIWAGRPIPSPDAGHAYRNWDLALDGKRMLVLEPAAGPAQPGSRTAATLLLNFFDELRRLSPAPR
jgi:serine/threonine-protein kinase